MISRILRSLVRSPIMLGAVFALVMLGSFLYSHPGHAAADNGYGCGVNTGDAHSMAGVIVNLYWVKADGSGTVQDSDDTVTIQTASPSSTHDGSGNPANVAKMSSDDSAELATVHQRTFRQVNANCNGNGYMVVLGYGQTSPDTADNWSYWALDCDVSIHPDHFQTYNIWPNGVPAGATGGGYWTTQPGGGGTHLNSSSPYTTDSHTQGANGSTFGLKFYYIEPQSHNYQAHFPNNLGCKTDVYIWAEDTDHPTNPIQAKVTFSGGPGGLPTLGPVYANDPPSEGVYNGHNSNNYHVWSMPSAIKSYTGTNDITAKLYAYDQAGNIIKDSSGSPKVFDTDVISTPCAGPPSLSVNGSCTNKVIYGTAQDSDKSSQQLTVKISVDGGAALTFTANQSPGHNYSYDASGLVWNATTYTHSFTVTAIGVDFNGNPDGKNTTKSKTLNCPPSGTTPSNCPGLNKQGENTTPPITLPSATPAAPGPYGYSPQSGATTSPGQQYYYEVPVGYKITSAYDQWATSVTWTPSGEQSSPNFTLDYSNYVNQYPYDDHNTTVNYYEYFNETYQYSSSSPDYYTCGGSYNGTNPICSYPAYSYYSCPSGGFLWGTRCYVYVGPATYHPTTNTYTCSSGSYVFGACYTSYNATLVYYCSPGSLFGTTCYYWGQPWYNWHNGGTTSNKQSNAASTTGQPLYQCFPRNFNVQGPNQTDVTGVSFDNYETPTQVRITTQVAVQFTLTHGGAVHLPMLVNGLNYNGNYYIKHANGSTVLLDSDNRPVGVGATTSSGTTITNNVPAPQPITYSISMPPLAVGDKVCAEFTVDPSGTEMDNVGNIQGNTASGSVSSTPIPLGSSCSAPIENHPYSRFYGNDVLAGAIFPGGTCNSAAHITANSTGPTGAGSQFAAMSIGAINGFASAFLRSLAPTQPTGLSFANTAGPFGGNFGGACTQIPDYSAEKPADNQSVSDLSQIGGPLAPLGGDTAFTAPGGTLSGLRVPAGANASIFVNGDIYITDDIMFDNSGWTYDASSHAVTVPSLYIIATGNIDISPNVHRLDGVYIARGSDGKGGTIRTCSSASNTAFPPANLFDACNSQLFINGAFLAKDVRLDRTFSSLRHSQSGENPLNGAIHNCDPNGIVSAADCSGEIFNFSPETYLANPALQPESGLNLNKYDYITSLPPVL